MEQIQLTSHENKKPIGFKVNIDGRWEDYDEKCNEVLLKAYKEGVPSVIMNLGNLPYTYEFDFGRMEQKCLNTKEIRKMSLPRESAMCIDRTDNGSRCCKTAQKHPVLVFSCSRDWIGKVISVPHPRKLRKTLPVWIPKEAKDGEAFFVSLPRKKLIQKVTYAVGGTICGVCTTLAVDAVAKGAQNSAIVGFVGLALCLALLGAVAIGGVALARGCKCVACIPETFVEMCGAKKVKYAVGGTIGGVCATIAVDAVAKGAFGGSSGKIGFAGLAPGLALLGAVALGAAALGAGYYISKYVSHNPGKIVAIGAMTIGSLLIARRIEPFLEELTIDASPEVLDDASLEVLTPDVFDLDDYFDIDDLIDDCPAESLSGWAGWVEWVYDFLS